VKERKEGMKELEAAVKYAEDILKLEARNVVPPPPAGLKLLAEAVRELVKHNEAPMKTMSEKVECEGTIKIRMYFLPGKMMVQAAVDSGEPLKAVEIFIVVGATAELNIPYAVIDEPRLRVKIKQDSERKAPAGKPRTKGSAGTRNNR
jgi:hypothetical protein